MIWTATTYVNPQQKLQTFLLRKKKTKQKNNTLATIDFHFLFFTNLHNFFDPNSILHVILLSYVGPLFMMNKRQHL